MPPRSTMQMRPRTRLLSEDFLCFNSSLPTARLKPYFCAILRCSCVEISRFVASIGRFLPRNYTDKFPRNYTQIHYRLPISLYFQGEHSQPQKLSFHSPPRV